MCLATILCLGTFNTYLLLKESPSLYTNIYRPSLVDTIFDSLVLSMFFLFALTVHNPQ